MDTMSIIVGIAIGIIIILLYRIVRIRYQKAYALRFHNAEFSNYRKPHYRNLEDKSLESLTSAPHTKAALIKMEKLVEFSQNNREKAEKLKKEMLLRRRTFE